MRKTQKIMHPEALHWSFKAFNFDYLILSFTLTIAIGIVLSVKYQCAEILLRVGNFSALIGVWMSMRGVFREGLRTEHDLNDSKPTLPAGKGFVLNSRFFNDLQFRLQDARLNVARFVLVVIGGALGLIGDLLLYWLGLVQR